MIKDCNWTKPFCNVTHMVVDGVQYTISYMGSGTFVELTTYSWVSYQVISKMYFFIKPFDEATCRKDNNDFWNCGSDEKAIQWAKFYVEHRGSYEMEINHFDLSRCEHLLEKEEVGDAA